MMKQYSKARQFRVSLIDWATYKKAHDMLRVPQEDIEEKPFDCGARVFPAIYRANAHSPRLPRCTSQYESLDIMDRTIDVKR